MEPHLDFAEGPDAQRLPQNVVANLDLGGRGHAPAPLPSFTAISHVVSTALSAINKLCNNIKQA